MLTEEYVVLPTIRTNPFGKDPLVVVVILNVILINLPVVGKVLLYKF